MPRTRRQHDARFKFKDALETARGLRTINEIASKNNVHPNQVSVWKKQLLEEGPVVSASGVAGSTVPGPGCAEPGPSRNRVRS